MTTDTLTLEDFDHISDLLDDDATVEDAQAIADVIDGIISENEMDAFAEFVNYTGEPITHELTVSFRDAYMGEWRSEEEFCEEMMNDMGDIPEHLVNYIDWEAVARDWFMSDYFSMPATWGRVHVFTSNY